MGGQLAALAGNVRVHARAQAVVEAQQPPTRQIVVEFVLKGRQTVEIVLFFGPCVVSHSSIP